MEQYLDTNKFNTLSELESYRKTINEALDERANFIATCNRASELGEKSFLFAKESFEAMAPALFESADGKKIINKYKATVKGSNNLSNLHSLCENVRKANKSIDTTYFVNNIADCDWNINKDGLKEDMKKLGKVIAEAYIFLGDKAEELIPTENKELAGAIEYIAENKRSYKNITEYSAAVKVLKENIEGVEGVANMFEGKSIDNIADKLVLEFNKKYDAELEGLERELVKEIASNSDKEAIFDKYKKACLTRIEEQKEVSKKENNTEEYEKLATITEQVGKKAYNEEKFTDDVCSLVKMISVLG